MQDRQSRQFERLRLSANDRQSEPHRKTPQQPDPCTPGSRDDGNGIEDGGAHLVRLLHVELLQLIAHIEPFASESHGERVWTDGMGDGQVEERSRDGEGGRRQGDQGVGRWRGGVAVTGGLQRGGARGEDVKLGGEVEVDRAVAVVQQVQLHLVASGVKLLVRLLS